MPVHEEKASKHDTEEQQPASTSLSKSELETSDIEAIQSQVFENEAASTVPPPPDGGYGWVCVLACLLVNGFTWGVVSVSSSRPRYHKLPLTIFSLTASIWPTTSPPTSILLPVLWTTPSLAALTLVSPCSRHPSSPSLLESSPSVLL